METKSKAAPTPGPWIAKASQRKVITYIEACVTGWIIAEIKRHRLGSADRHPSAEVARANARLIAAAPELLEACKEVVAWAKTPQDHGGNPYRHAFVLLAEKAIAKAEGRDGE